MSINLISKYRKQLLAVGMIWLAIFHSYLSFGFKPFNFIFETCGYAGVDIFMFLSGFGLYYAYKKENKYIDFIKRRLIKVLPYNIIICIVWKFVYDRGILETVLDALGLSIFFRHNLTGWYTSFMILLYLLTPLYLKIFNGAEKEVTFSTILLIFLVCLLHGVGTFSYIYFRSAIYILGIYFGYLNENNKKVNTLLLVALMIIGWVWMYYAYHNYGNGIQHVYPLILIIPGTCLLLAYVFDKITILNKPLCLISKYTYQFYLVHITVLEVLYRNYDKFFISIPYFDVLFNIFIIILAFILSILLTRLIDLFINNIIKKRGV